MSIVGILHPGEMGVSIGAAAAHNPANQVFWVNEGRSVKTRDRAEKAQLNSCATLRECVAKCNVLISVVPPESSHEQFSAVLALGFRGIYVDANAISPQHSKALAESCRAAASIEYVDASIIGGPAWKKDETRMYLCGSAAERVAALFAGSLLATQILEVDADSLPSRASALKMSFAAFNKGRTALLYASIAAAEALGVRNELEEQWRRDGDHVEKVERMRKNTAKAWRWAGEMREISETFASCGVPGELHRGAEIVFERLAVYKDAPALPAIDSIAKSVLKKDSNTGQ